MNCCIDISNCVYGISAVAYLSTGDSARRNNASAMTRLRAIRNDGSLDVTDLTVRGGRTPDTEISLNQNQ